VKTMRAWETLRRSLTLPFRCPAVLAISIGYAGLLYAASLRAGYTEIRSPYWVLSVAGLLLLSPIYHALVLPMIARDQCRESVHGGSVVEDVLITFPRFFIGEIVVAAAVAVGAMLFLIPGVYVGMRLVYYKQEIALKRQPVGDALRASYQRTRDGRTTSRLFAGLVILCGSAIGVNTALALLGSSSVVHVGSIVCTGVLLAWMNALVTASYDNSGTQTSEG